jgi:hypothetical protein
MLQRDGCDLTVCFREALFFISQPTVQDEIDRVANVLLERNRLTGDEVRAVARFTESLCSADWRSRTSY